MYIPRLAAKTVQELSIGYPVVAIVGPRQAGKTVLAREIFPSKPYVSLEDLDRREFATEDPRGFLNQYPNGAILDEVQRTPNLFSYLQGVVDQDGRSGLFILTGSSQFNLLSGITQSLAGRVALIPLMPFTLGELQQSKQAPERLEQLLFQGLYPPIYDRHLNPTVWYGNYVATYIERDVRQMVNVRDLSNFDRFVRLCAARTGHLLNLASLATDCGISPNTARAWLSVLEASYIVHLLPPHHRNFQKRLVKTPKLYFYDTGLATWLLGIQNPDQLSLHPAKGALFENWVVSELLKARFNRGLSSNLYFWRDRTGNEVDVLVDRGAKIVPLEIKAGQTLNRRFFTGLKRWRDLAGAEADQESWLLYGGTERQERESVSVVPWQQVDTLAP